MQVKAVRLVAGTAGRGRPGRRGPAPHLLGTNRTSACSDQAHLDGLLVLLTPGSMTRSAQ